MTDVLDVYELTPLQAGMLFHSLMAPGSGSYVQQCWCTLEGRLEVAAFRAAWQAVMARHEVLRSECHWEELDRPVQVVYDAAEPEWCLEDWDSLSPERHQQALDDWLAADRARGFRLDRAPLMRFALIRLGEERHRFVWSFHHLLMDGWCGSLLVREVLRLYAGQALPLAPPPYRRYVEWRAAQDCAAAERYWGDALAGIAGPTPLGIDSATGANGVLELRETLSPTLAGRLAALARTERLTLNTLLQGAWALLLARYSGQDDVTFGGVLSGRPPELPDVEAMIGLFLNTVPVRVNASPGQRLIPWLRACQAEQRQRERHGHAALTDIKRWSGLPGGEALFDSLLIVENYPLFMTAAAAEGAPLTLRDGGSYERTHYPLTLKAFPGETTELALAIDLSRITPEAGRRVLAHLRNVLTAFAATPGARLGEIELTEAAERERVLGWGRGPDAANAPPMHEQFLTRAAAAPHATALELEGRAGAIHVTYAELARRAQAIAAHLRERGAGPGTVVAIGLDRGPDLVAAMLGVLIAGAAYLPIDPDYPAERIAHMLADSGAQLMLTSGRTAIAPVQRIEAIDVNALVSAGSHATPPPASVTPDHLAYLLYTSGSTGRPKGVPVSHGSLSNFLQSMALQPGLAAADRLLALTTVAFDIAALELLGPLSQSGAVLLTDAATARDGMRLAALIQRTRPTIMQATPAGWRMLIEAGWPGLPGLTMLCGGEALDSGLAAALLPRGAALWNLYGPTETTIWSAALRVDASILDGAAVPVGGPLDRTQLQVLDAQGGLAPVGVPGELAIGGAGLSPGYWRMPALTAERFIPDAEGGASQHGGRLYRTGDRVRWREDGRLDVLGRIDNQVKLRGHRIELGEIEACLARHPAVAQAVVMVDGGGAGSRLVACIRWGSEAAGDGASVLGPHLAVTLPAYMLPSAYVALEQIPLTPNGKVDRRAVGALIAAAGGPRHPAREADAPALPSGEPAATLAAIWREVLRVPRVRTGDNFFHIGGNSLLVVTVQSAIRQRLGVPVEIVDIFRFPTLESLAGHIAALSLGSPGATAPQARAEALALGRDRLRQRRQRRA